MKDRRKLWSSNCRSWLPPGGRWYSQWLQTGCSSLATKVEEIV